MKRVLAVLAVVALVASGAFAPASAQEEKAPRHGHSDGMGGRMGGMMESMMGGATPAERPLISLALQNKEQLGLTAEQVTALESLRSEFQKEAIRRLANRIIAEIELAELLRTEPADLAKAEAKLRQIEGLRTELRLSRIKMLEKGKALLTPEQRKNLDSLTARASADAHGGMMGGRGMEDMQRFMRSERMPHAMTAMMEMARQMGDGDPMLGMVRMMEMMGTMGQMMGGQMGGMMGPGQPSR